MRTYSLAVRTVATAATAGKPGAVLWNPSSNKRLWVVQVGWSKITGTADFQAIARVTARGTQTTTLAAATANDFDNDGVPGTAATIDTAWSVDPTIVTATPNFRWNLGAAVGAGFIWNPPASKGGIELAPGAGLAVYTPVATIMQAADCTFVWEE